MKRLLAAVGAIAMVGVAVLIRGAVTGGGDGGGSGGNGGDGGTHFICATELEAACAALAEADGDITFDVEEAGVMAERLVDPAFRASDTDIDGWLTLNPWPELVNDRLGRANLRTVLSATSDVLATSKLAIVGPSERIDILAANCGGGSGPGWKCLGDVAGGSWDEFGGNVSMGQIEVGHDDPTESATGLLILGQAASDYFGDTGFASNDFGTDAGFRPWLEQLENADPNLPLSVQSLPVINQLEQLPVASWDAVGTLDPAATAAKRRTDDTFTVLYPSPMIRAEAVLAPIVGHEVDIDTDDLTNALEAAGWSPGPAPDDAPAGPSAGVYEALITEWEQATR